jgi:hypothetical protein
MPLTQAEYSKRWRANHREKDREFHITYYINNKDKESKRQQKKYLWNKETQRLRNILL